MANKFNTTVKTLDEAYNLIAAYLKMMSPEDRCKFWEYDNDWPQTKVQSFLEELMPDYNIDYFCSTDDDEPNDIYENFLQFISSLQGYELVDMQYLNFACLPGDDYADPFWVVAYQIKEYPKNK